MKQGILGACALGLSAGWNVANTGAVAQQLADSYGVSLAAIGLLTTALFITHLAMQIPGGRMSDRYGARRAGLVGLALIVVFSTIAMAAPVFELGLAMRALTGLGTGLGFIAGSAYVRAIGGSPAAQGLYGGSDWRAAAWRSRSSPGWMTGSAGGRRSRPPSSLPWPRWRCWAPRGRTRRARDPPGRSG